jgi:hypothetical protein
MRVGISTGPGVYSRTRVEVDAELRVAAVTVMSFRPLF